VWWGNTRVIVVIASFSQTDVLFAHDLSSYIHNNNPISSISSQLHSAFSTSTTHFKPPILTQITFTMDQSSNQSMPEILIFLSPLKTNIPPDYPGASDGPKQSTGAASANNAAGSQSMSTLTSLIFILLITTRLRLRLQPRRVPHLQGRHRSSNHTRCMHFLTSHKAVPH